MFLYKLYSNETSQWYYSTWIPVCSITFTSLIIPAVCFHNDNPVVCSMDILCPASLALHQVKERGESGAWRWRKNRILKAYILKIKRMQFAQQTAVMCVWEFNKLHHCSIRVKTCYLISKELAFLVNVAKSSSYNRDDFHSLLHIIQLPSF